jgi:hypothetical protein
VQTFPTIGSSNPNPLTSYRMHPPPTRCARRYPDASSSRRAAAEEAPRATPASRRGLPPPPGAPHQPMCPACARHGRPPRRTPGADLGRCHPRAPGGLFLPPDPRRGPRAAFQRAAVLPRTTAARRCSPLLASHASTSIVAAVDCRLAAPSSPAPTTRAGQGAPTFFIF